MPTYEYRREDGTTFEYMQSINADPLTECPDTGQKVQRVITGGGGVVYKGDGWYVTDYKNAGSKKAGSAPAKSDSDSSSETKSESADSSATTKSSGEA